MKDDVFGSGKIPNQRPGKSRRCESLRRPVQAKVLVHVPECSQTDLRRSPLIGPSRTSGNFVGTTRRSRDRKETDKCTRIPISHRPTEVHRPGKRATRVPAAGESRFEGNGAIQTVRSSMSRLLGLFSTRHSLYFVPSAAFRWKVRKALSRFFQRILRTPRAHRSAASEMRSLRIYRPPLR